MASLLYRVFKKIGRFFIARKNSLIKSIRRFLAGTSIMYTSFLYQNFIWIYVQITITQSLYAERRFRSNALWQKWRHDHWLSSWWQWCIIPMFGSLWWPQSHVLLVSMAAQVKPGLIRVVTNDCLAQHNAGTGAQNELAIPYFPRSVLVRSALCREILLDVFNVCGTQMRLEN